MSPIVSAEIFVTAVSEKSSVSYQPSNTHPGFITSVGSVASSPYLYSVIFPLLINPPFVSKVTLNFNSSFSDINFGSNELVTVPSPSCPLSFAPHVYNEALSSIATLLFHVVATLVNLVPSFIFVSSVFPSVVPSPNSPSIFEPHAYRLPFSSIANVWLYPIDMSVNTVFVVI